MAVNIILIILCLVFSGLFSSAEMAFSTVNKIRLKNYASQGNKRAEKALEIATKFDNALMAILIGNNVVNTASASIGTILFTEIFGSGGVGVATMVMTVLVLIFGEILPCEGKCGKSCTYLCCTAFVCNKAFHTCYLDFHED